jgi:hypothetical protein
MLQNHENDAQIGGFRAHLGEIPSKNIPVLSS